MKISERQRIVNPRIESVIPAKEVLKGQEVLYRGTWWPVARVTQNVDSLGLPVTWLLFEEMPSALLFDAEEMVDVR